MKILALDPGTHDTAYITEGQSFIYGHESNHFVLEYVSVCDADIVAIEMIASYGMAVGKETFETCVWIGRFIQAALDSGKKVILVPRIQVKLHLCQTTRAKDANIRQALLDKYGAQGSKKEPGRTYGISKHIWAALAVYDYAKENLEKDANFCAYDNKKIVY